MGDPRQANGNFAANSGPGQAGGTSNVGGAGGKAGTSTDPGANSGSGAQGTGIVNGNPDSKLRGTQGGKMAAVPRVPGVPSGAASGGSSNDSSAGGDSSGGTQSGGSAGASSMSMSGQQGGGGSSSSQDITMPQQQTPAIGMPSLNLQKRKPDSLAKQRGSDWALPDASHSSVPVSRPVVLECRADRLLIMTDDGKSVAQEIPLGPKTTDAVDELRSAVWDHMKSWGAAGKGLYWKPTLSVRVAPDGRARFDELQALFIDSGLDLHESTRTAAPPPPPKKRWWKS
jgi:hypothetical protein